MEKRRIIKNQAQCLKCGDLIESTHVHDYRTCNCGNLSVDGGEYYLKRCFKEGMDSWFDCSVYEEVPSYSLVAEEDNNGKTL